MKLIIKPLRIIKLEFFQHIETVTECDTYQNTRITHNPELEDVAGSDGDSRSPFSHKGVKS